MTQTIALTPAGASTTTRVSDPQVAILRRAQRDGYVSRGADATDTQLRALARRGMVDLVIVLDGRRKVIAGARINKVGINALARTA